MDVSTILVSAGVAAQPTSQHMGNGAMGGVWMGLHWGWWLITIVVLAFLVSMFLRMGGRGRGDS